MVLYIYKVRVLVLTIKVYNHVILAKCHFQFAEGALMYDCRGAERSDGPHGRDELRPGGGRRRDPRRGPD
jgi:hypothetical protein